jgi:hypothetical protein
VGISRVVVGALVAEEPFELFAEVVGRRDRRLGPPVVVLLEHLDVHRELEVVLDDLVVERPPPGDLVGRGRPSAGTRARAPGGSGARTACGCSAFIR